MTEEILYCSFCEKSSEDVDALIKSEETNICNECVELCSQIIMENKMKPSETQQLEIDQVKLNHLMATTESLRLKIAEAKIRILTERKCEEKELSAAEEWTYAQPVLFNKPICNENWIVNDARIKAHEAGQKHGYSIGYGDGIRDTEECERERHRPLIELTKRYKKSLMGFSRPITVERAIKEIEQILKNLESDTEPEPVTDAAVVIKTDQNTTAGYTDITIRTGINTPFRIMDSVKLTPIKEPAT